MNIALKKVTSEEDIELFCKWTQEPHVNEFWHLTYEEARNKITPRTKPDSLVKPFFILINDKPTGYIQYYEAVEKTDDFWKDEPIGTYGIDIFIGEKEYINKGYGTEIIKEFCDYLFKNIKNCKRIIIDPYTNNYKAIRCYEKAGFIKVETRRNEEGKKEVLIMEKR